jgi:hypothetical protein
MTRLGSSLDLPQRERPCARWAVAAVAGLLLMAREEFAAGSMLGRRCGCRRESADGLTPTSEPNDG